MKKGLRLENDAAPKPVRRTRRPAVAKSDPGASTPGETETGNGTLAPPVPGDGDTLTVGQLTRRIKRLLESGFVRVAVEGEVSAARPAASGHVYFSLKDDEALLDAVVWRSTALRLKTPLRDGDRVVCHGGLSLYEPRGRYQLIVSRVEAAGRGDARQRLEALTEQLRREGLFDPERKQPLPAFPKVVGLATSAHGAALRDMVRIFRRRAPWVRLVLADCRVQGEEAIGDVVDALRRLVRFGCCDAVVIGRGGGSAEDLGAFNDEAVVRAVAAMPCPVVSAVGHETDVTLVDFVADRRAATPSEAAELLAPDRREAERRLARLSARLARAIALPFALARQRHARLSDRDVWRRPRTLLTSRRLRWDDAADRLRLAPERRLALAAARLSTAAAGLSALSPLGVLARGFGVTTRSDGRIVRGPADVADGERLRTRLRDGEVFSQVIDLRK